MPTVSAWVVAAATGAGAQTFMVSAYAVDGSPPSAAEATISGSADATFAAAVLGLPGAPAVEAGFELWVDGELTDQSQLLGRVEVDQQLDRPMQTWRVDLRLDTPDGVFGNPLVRGAPSTGVAPITIYAAYRQSGQVYRFPLVTNGIATKSKRRGEISPGTTVGYREELSGTDAMGRFDHQPVTAIIDAGSGLTRDRAIQQLLEPIGDLATALEVMGTLNREVQIVDGDPYQLAQEWCDLEGRRLLRDRAGFLWNPREGLLNNARAQAPVMTLDEYAIVSVQEQSEEVNAEVPTYVTLTGTKQIVTPPQPTAAHTSKVQEVVTSGWRVPAQAAFLQGSDCSLGPVGSSGSLDPQFEEFELQRTTFEYLGGVLVAQTVETYAFVWLEAARYRWDEATHAQTCIAGVYLPAGAVASDQNGAYAEQNEHWRLIGRVRTEYYYDWIGFQGPDGDPTDPWHLAFKGTAQSSEANGSAYLLGTITATESYYSRRAAWKQAETSTPWQSIDPIDGTYFRGGGDAVADPTAAWYLTKKQVVVHQVDKSGLLVSTTEYDYGFNVYPGSMYLYQAGDAQESSQPQETFELTGFSSTTYVQVDESTVQTAEATFSYDGSTYTPATATKITTGPGAPPSGTRLPESITAPQTGSVAEPSNTQPIKVRVKADALLGTHVPYVLKTSLAWAEDEQELANAGLYLIERAAAVPVTITTRLLGMLCVGDWVHLTQRILGIDSVAEVAAAKHFCNGHASDPPLSQFVCKVYPVVSPSAIGALP
jgi:hypothetical protein